MDNDAKAITIRGGFPIKKDFIPFLSNTFKLWVVTIIFFLIFLHLYSISVFPRSYIVPQELLLSVVLVLVAFLWIQELRDRLRLQRLHRALVDAHSQLQEEEIATISVLILTEEAKDPYLRGHSHQVARCSIAIGREMGLSPERQRILRRASILHDLGKLGIADDILKKRGSLDDREWDVMRDHPQRSVDILKPLDFLTAEKKIILHHHERYDGDGHPAGLKGDSIPLEARIIAASDTFDAMNSERSYRKALSREDIVSELRKVSGDQLDPSVVNILVSLLEKDATLWEREEP